MANTNRTNIHELFLQFVRLGIGTDTNLNDNHNQNFFEGVDWMQLKTLADVQGLSAVVLDGIDAWQGLKSLSCSNSLSADSPPLQLKLEWIGEVLQGEQTYKLQHEVARDMSNLFHNNAIRTYVLKGDVIAECYPKPNHRVSVDVDCYLLPAAEFKGLSGSTSSPSVQEVQGDSWDAWSLGNDLIRSKHFDVKTDFYKNSTFEISGVVVENHQYLVPFRGNERLEKLERFFQEKFKEFNGLSVQELENSRIGDSWLYRPPMMVSALFLIEHAYSHFLHEGLTWRMVLDWMLFRKKHETEIHWGDFEALIDEYGFRKFYDSFSLLGQYLIGVIQDSGFKIQEKKMLNDIWAPLDVHETVRGWKGKIALAGNTWRARWKYHYYTEISWVAAFWIQVKGFLFDKNPSLT